MAGKITDHGWTDATVKKIVLAVDQQSIVRRNKSVVGKSPIHKVSTNNRSAIDLQIE